MNKKISVQAWPVKLMEREVTCVVRYKNKNYSKRLKFNSVKNIKEAWPMLLKGLCYKLEKEGLK